MLSKKIKAFTLAEMLVTLALTSVMVTFSYLGLTSMQKLLVDYKNQTNFISKLNELNKRIEFLFTKANTITRVTDEKLIFKTDSVESKVVFGSNYVLTIKDNVTDTFQFEQKALKITYEGMADITSIELINGLEFDIYFKKQKFHLTFSKNYDAFSKLKFATDEKH
ncbi:MAG: prepilin-type N-terminal cleavage/methylation domain-containing protein [Bacteroidia bacterium]|nr:prepilin-type N-terminal cleavage/methylation domain-containing protein [Bacteroidia bacterium]